MIYWELLKKFWPFALALVLFAGGYGYGHHNDHKAMQAKLDALQHDYDQFQAEVQAKGEAAQKAADEANKANQLAKEKADNDYQTALARLSDDNRKLRDKERARGSYVPEAAPTSRKPDQACFDRAQLESAIGQLVAGFQAIADQGSEDRLELNNARIWAQK